MRKKHKLSGMTSFPAYLEDNVYISISPSEGIVLENEGGSDDPLPPLKDGAPGGARF